MTMRRSRNHGGGSLVRRGVMATILCSVLLTVVQLVTESTNVTMIPPSELLLSSSSLDSPTRIISQTPATALLRVSPTPSSTSSCRRSCHHRKNKIVLGPLGMEGLDDRRMIFDFMTSLAGYLCATVHAPRPHIMLSSTHNGKKAVPRDLMWRDFFSYSFVEDNATALEQYHDMQPATKTSAGPKSSSLKLTLMIGPPHDPQVRRDVISQVTQLERYVQAQQQQQQQESTTANSTSVSSIATNSTAFVWEVRLAHFYWGIRNFTDLFILGKGHRPSSLPLLEKLGVISGSCRYTQQHNTALAQHLVDRVFAYIQNMYPETTGLAFFHIRRGDTLKVCNTTLPRMRNYLMCSLRGGGGGEMAARISAEDFGTTMTLLLASDERDPCYRRAIQTIVEEDLGYNFVDLDQVIWTVLRDYVQMANNTKNNTNDDSRLLNNMYVFYLNRMVSSDDRVDLELIQRRANCLDCARDMKRVVVNQNSSDIGFQAETASPLEGRLVDWDQTLKDYERCTTNRTTIGGL